MSRDANIAAQEKLAEGINAGNTAVVHEVFAENVVDHDPAPDQGPGPEGFHDFFKALTSAFPDAKIEPQQLVADDDNVAVAYTLTGTHEGEFHGVAPTGKQIEVRGVQIARFEDARIVERWGSTDELGILRQLADPAG
ncbi:MAG: ester cyclase [Actinomycetota bacterium]|nr:ester cyclase [Actinomycetota bacterium]